MEEARLQFNNVSETPGKPESEYSEENIVLFYNKTQIDKFMASLVRIQNQFVLQSQKYFVPAILCNSPRDLDQEAMIILRNVDVL